MVNGDHTRPVRGEGGGQMTGRSRLLTPPVASHGLMSLEKPLPSPQNRPDFRQREHPGQKNERKISAHTHPDQGHQHDHP